MVPELSRRGTQVVEGPVVGNDPVGPRVQLFCARLLGHPSNDVMASRAAVDGSLQPRLFWCINEHPGPVIPQEVSNHGQFNYDVTILVGRHCFENSPSNGRMGYLFEAPQLLHIGEHRRGQPLAIDFAFRKHIGPDGLDRPDSIRVGDQDFVSNPVGVDHQCAGLAEQTGECRLARADAPENHDAEAITRDGHTATVPFVEMATNLRNWEQRVDWTLSAILWIGFGLSLFLTGLREGATPGVGLAGVFAGTYVVAMQVTPRRLRNARQIGEILAIVGVIVALVGIALTGGIDSGYVIFMIAPAFFAGAFLGIRIGLETALLAAIGYVMVIAALGQPILDGRVIESVVLFVLIAITMSQMRRILVEERIRSDELAAATELRINRLETAHDLLETLSNLAGATELNPITVGEAALRDLGARVPFESGQVTVMGDSGEVVVATRGNPPTDSPPYEYAIQLADREVGRLRLWPRPNESLDGWQESIEFALQPVAIAFENSLLLQHIAHRAVTGERTRIARELHDDIGPSLASLGLSIDMAIHQFDVGPDLGRHLETTRQHITALTETVRGTAADLRRSATESVVEQAHQLAADTTAEGPSVTIAIDEQRPPRGERAIEINAIITEAFRNAISHSGASTIAFQGYVDRDTGWVTVSDDGTGFDPSIRPPGHFGLIGMKERAENIEAELDITPRPGGGTIVRLQWGGSK